MMIMSTCVSERKLCVTLMPRACEPFVVFCVWCYRRPCEMPRATQDATTPDDDEHEQEHDPSTAHGRPLTVPGVTDCGAGGHKGFSRESEDSALCPDCTTG